MYGSDVWVIERGGSFSLDFESFTLLGIAGDLTRPQLNRNRAFEFGVLGFVGDTPATLAAASFFMIDLLQQCVSRPSPTLLQLRPHGK